MGDPYDRHFLEQTGLRAPRELVIATLLDTSNGIRRSPSAHCHCAETKALTSIIRDRPCRSIILNGR